MQTDLLAEIQAFLAKTAERSKDGEPMGKTYFGQKAVRNPHLVGRLERGKTVTLDTAARVRAFIAERERAQ
jgi:hypothetical protein